MSTLHTKLTTYKALRLYRELNSTFVTVFIKEMPSGAIDRFVVDAEYAVFNLWNMFDAHSLVAARSACRMLVLPTSRWLFELDNDISAGDDTSLAKTAGLLPLHRYGIRAPGSATVLLSFPQYSRTYAPTLISAFFKQNSAFSLLEPVAVASNLDLVPPDLQRDQVQRTLLILISAQYSCQRAEQSR
jgi:hypothetical protein